MKIFKSLLSTTLLITLFFSCAKEGCKDPSANNYDKKVTKENGTCTYDAVTPLVQTKSITGIWSISATCGGEILDRGTSNVTKYGICWSTSSSPTVDNEKTVNNIGSTDFTNTLTSLTQNTTYYVRAYATNNEGTGYGDEKSFSTYEVTLATTTTSTPTLITTTEITIGGTINNNGNGDIFERGICWSTSPAPTINDNHQVDSTNSGSTFTLNLTGLTSETTYYIRSYATNYAGTAYGQEIIYVNPHVTFIGEFYQGGVVIRIDNTGLHGTVCTISDQSSGAPWGCAAVSGVYDAQNTGTSNTLAIISACPTPGIAAEICYNLDMNGYNDWFLPTYWEILDIKNRRNEINSTSNANGGDILSPTFYWGSNAVDLSNNASAYDFSTETSSSLNKNTLNYVRAIRTF